MPTGHESIGVRGPDVSVVIPVRNAASDIAVTIQTLLDQEGVSLEVVVVDDGSEDATRSVVARLAEGDGRVRLLHQTSAGITKALARGCAAAEGRLLARQDAAGTSARPGRLAKPAHILDACPEVSLVSCGVHWLAPSGRPLEDAIPDAVSADGGLRARSVRDLRGPVHHAATMFRRVDYERVGGYRTPFRFAQDIDLWLRLAELGRHDVVPEVLAVRTLRAVGTSAWMRAWQGRFAELALRAAALRARGDSDAAVLDEAAELSRLVPSRPSRKARAEGHYHVGCRLRRRYPRESRRFLWNAWRTTPWDARPLIRMVLAP